MHLRKLSPMLTSFQTGNQNRQWERDMMPVSITAAFHAGGAD